MITVALTDVPSASRAVACPSAWSIARTWTRCRTTAPFSSARPSSAASNSSRTTMASSGSALERLNSLPPRSVNVADLTSSLTGSVELAGHGRLGDAEQAAAAGLVPGMLGPLEDDGPRPGGGGSARGGQPGRPAADHGHIPVSTFSHAKA